MARIRWFNELIIPRQTVLRVNQYRTRCRCDCIRVLHLSGGAKSAQYITSPLDFVSQGSVTQQVLQPVACMHEASRPQYRFQSLELSLSLGFRCVTILRPQHILSAHVTRGEGWLRDDLIYWLIACMKPGKQIGRLYPSSQLRMSI